jgi:glutathione-regulated potassium-efflux system ancillary protein KefC/glutathione-regulated potassium-efflux system protein KefB
MTDSVLSQAFVYLCAAVVAVPVAQRLGLGSVLGYLLAGVLIGPHVLNLVGAHEDVMHFAEFGVVMMLFMIGLELRPALLWRLRGPILGLGGAQVAGTAALIFGLALLAGRRWPEALALGLILAMSSTAIVLQSLAERGTLKTRGGQACFSVLLFQDIAVIPILALLPVLANAMHGAGVRGGAAHGSMLAALPGWAQTLVTIGAVVAIIVAGRLGLPPLLRLIAKAKVRDIFTATALLLVVGISLLMTVVGLSPALGTFVAGVVLSESDYRHELEADIEPFKGLLLGLFFITVGAGIDFALLAEQPGLIAALVLGLIVVKFTVLAALGAAFKLEAKATWLLALALAQGGEFCFVLLSMAQHSGVLASAVAKPLVGAVALSMALTPLLFLVNERLVQPRFAQAKARRAEDAIDEQDHAVILAGFGRFGHVVGRLLRANGLGVTVLDNDPDQVDLLAQFGMKAFYGDASRRELLAAAGAERARLFICAIDHEEKSLEIVKLVQREFPHLQIIARAESRQHAYELLRLGIDRVHRVTFASALDLGVDALRTLGLEAGRAQRAAQVFKEYDEAGLRELLKHYDAEDYVSLARQHVQNLENVLRDDRERLSPAPAADGPPANGTPEGLLPEKEL